MSTAFFLVGAPASVAVGVLVDRLNRRGMLLGLCCLAGLTSLLSAAAQTVWQLVVLRAILGFATGALQPLMFSVVGDLFEPASRPSVSSYVGLSIGAGVAIGQLFAGLSAPRQEAPCDPLECALALRCRARVKVRLAPALSDDRAGILRCGPWHRCRGSRAASQRRCGQCVDGRRLPPSSCPHSPGRVGRGSGRPEAAAPSRAGAADDGPALRAGDAPAAVATTAVVSHTPLSPRTCSPYLGRCPGPSSQCSSQTS